MSQQQNTDCSDLVEGAANEAKRLKWSQDISAALFQLGELQREWDRLDSDIRNRKARVIYELAEKL
jgi:phage host-nuclease inhibitor protein Gam